MVQRGFASKVLCHSSDVTVTVLMSNFLLRNSAILCDSAVMIAVKLMNRRAAENRRVTQREFDISTVTKHRCCDKGLLRQSLPDYYLVSRSRTQSSSCAASAAFSLSTISRMIDSVFEARTWTHPLGIVTFKPSVVSY